MTGRRTPFGHTVRYACLLAAWAVLALVVASLQPPSWLGLPVVGIFSLLGVGLALELVVAIRDWPIAIALTVAVGVSSLILTSEFFLITDRLRPLAGLTVQVIVACGLALWAALRARNASRAQQSRGEQS